jgi:hypothetical protein
MPAKVKKKRPQFTTEAKRGKGATKRKTDLTTKHTKSTKEEKYFLRFDSRSPIFVSFAPFVVR